MSVVIGIAVLAVLATIAMYRKNTTETGKKAGIITSKKKFLISFRAFNTAFLCMMFIMISTSPNARSCCIITMSAGTQETSSHYFVSAQWRCLC